MFLFYCKQVIEKIFFFFFFYQSSEAHVNIKNASFFIFKRRLRLLFESLLCFYCLGLHYLSDAKSTPSVWSFYRHLLILKWNSVEFCRKLLERSSIYFSNGHWKRKSMKKSIKQVFREGHKGKPLPCYTPCCYQKQCVKQFHFKLLGT